MSLEERSAKMCKKGERISDWITEADSLQDNHYDVQSFTIYN